MEELGREKGLVLNKLSFKEMDGLWEEAKKAVEEKS
jgi:uncharacterized protein YabN with tetrapyrrole methylase and pyrophosphatase domain